jgi:hypothetical protein
MGEKASSSLHVKKFSHTVWARKLTCSRNQFREHHEKGGLVGEGRLLERYRAEIIQLCRQRKTQAQIRRHLEDKAAHAERQ